MLSLAGLGLLVSPIVALSQQTSARGGQPIVSTTPAARPTQRRVASDIRLGPNGSFSGSLSSQNGQPLSKQQVTLVRNGQIIQTATTDAQGRFQLTPGSAGSYILMSKATKSARRLRVWSSDTAPPTAQSSLLMVSGEQVVRGGYNPSAVYSWMEAHPILAYGTLATIITVPIVLIARRKNS